MARRGVLAAMDQHHGKRMARLDERRRELRQFRKRTIGCVAGFALYYAALRLVLEGPLP